MTTNAKIGSTVGVILASLALDAFLRPAANLQANHSIVGQLAHSNTSSLSNTYLGNGQWLASVLVYAVLAVALLFIWTRKENSK